MVRTDTFTLTGDDNPERVRGSRVTASLMPLLGIAPRLGRNFTPAEDLDGTAGVAILSDGLWRRRYGADEHVLGRTIQIDGESRTVVGVMPRGAALPGPLAGDDDLWLPARLTPAERVNEVSHNHKILGRLADGVTLAQASAELEALAARMAAERPSHRELGGRVVPIAEQTVRSIRPTLLLIAGCVALLLLVASANASTLLLARASSRRHELAVRTALGATRGRLLSLAFAESLVFASLGGLAGLFLGGWALRAVLPLFAGSLPAAIPDRHRRPRRRCSPRRCPSSLGLLFGGVVAAHRPGGRLVDALEDVGADDGRLRGARAQRARRRAGRARGGPAVGSRPDAEQRRQAVTRASGIRRRSPADVQDRAERRELRRRARRGVAFVSDLLERLRATPGVQQAALSSIIPFGGQRGANGFEIEGRPAAPGQTRIADQRHVSPDYFQTMNIPLVQGRGFQATDDRRGEPVVIINRAMANRFWPNENPIDRRVRTSAGFDSGILVPHRRRRGGRAARVAEPRSGDRDVPSDRADGHADLHAGRADRTVNRQRSRRRRARRCRRIDPEPADLRRANDGGPDCRHRSRRRAARCSCCSSRRRWRRRSRASRSTDRSGTR